MKHATFILVITLLFTGCVSTKKFSSFVNPTFKHFFLYPTQDENENISVDLSKLEAMDDAVKSEALKSRFIPAVLFWQSVKEIECLISPQCVGDMFKFHFINYSKALGLSEKLGSRKLTVIIEEIPASFLYTYKNSTIILGSENTYTSLEEAIYPVEQDFVIWYELQENGQTKISEEIHITNRDTPMENSWRSTKSFTKKYVKQFENNIQNAAEETAQLFLDIINHF